MKRRTHRQRTLGPLQDKTLFNMLRQLFISEFGYEKKAIFAEAMIDRILDTIAAFTVPSSRLKPGQVLWLAVANDGRKHTRQRMNAIPQVPVVLDLVHDDDLRELAAGTTYPELRRRRMARLLEQAFVQGGVLAQSDVAALTLVPPSRVGRAIARYQKEEQCSLPTRGSVQDLGPTLSHKVEVIGLLEAGYLEPEICRRLSMVHSLESVERYVQTYKNVIKLVERGFAPTEISGILSLGERLLDTYIDIIDEHHPALITGNPHFTRQPAGRCLPQPTGHKS
ncbi:MAG: DUF1670 domain-containing protein [Deltaproteobacteria bacterium]|nr:DUF1670 domain-containing protein [Deltaproteobacteria bacterium]